jgi:glycine C-acetyltransferase
LLGLNPNVLSSSKKYLLLICYREICDLADKYNSLVFIDECHATGFFGATGRGTEEYLNLAKGRVHIINSTLGKAVGGAAGGYTTGCKEIVDLLRQRSRPYLFSNTLPPAVVGGAAKALDLIMKDTSLPKKVADNTARFRNKMKALGFTIAVSY